MPDVATNLQRVHPDRSHPERTVVARFEICYRRYLDADGNTADGLPPLARDADRLRALYRAMTLTRLFDKRAVAMQRIGQIGTYASSLGQEAVPVGVAAAMAQNDVLLPTYRDQGAMLWRGVTPAQLLLSWGGDERGNQHWGPAEDFPPAIPIASQAPHAVGVATAIKLRGEHRAAVCMLGDGATSKGDFYEALNLAGVWSLPVLFVVTNNQWAISLPRASQSAAETLAQKAIAGGVPAEQVDGNDVLAVHQAATEALERARSGLGASLIEALTYRLSDHTTADDASRYRSTEEVSAHWPAEPLTRLRAYLGRLGWWSKADEEALLKDCERIVEEGRAAYLAMPADHPTAMFDHLFATLPRSLAVQRRRFEENGHG